MPKRNRHRAARRNLERTKRDQAAVATGAALAADPKPRRNARHKPVLEVLRQRGSITPSQFQAGDRLYRDWRASGSQLGRLVAHYGPPSPRGSGQRDTQHALDARARFEAALREVGHGLAPILMHCCVTDESPATWAGLNGKALTDGPPVLRVALDVLAEFYRNGPARQAA
jgi:hypothetical protein